MGNSGPHAILITRLLEKILLIAPHTPALFAIYRAIYIMFRTGAFSVINVEIQACMQTLSTRSTRDEAGVRY